MHEFTTLCDVPACIIIQEENSSKKSEIWPENQDEVHRLINMYKSKTKEDGSGCRTFVPDDFLCESIKNTEDDLSNLRKKNIEANYSTQPECINSMTEGQLRELAQVLSKRAEYVKCKIETLKRSLKNKQGVMDANNFMHFDNTMYSRPPLPLLPDIDIVGATDPRFFTADPSFYFDAPYPGFFTAPDLGFSTADPSFFLTAPDPGFFTTDPSFFFDAPDPGFSTADPSFFFDAPDSGFSTADPSF